MGTHTNATTVRLESGATPAAKAGSLSTVIPRLMGFAGKLDSDEGLPCALDDYLELVASQSVFAGFGVPGTWDLLLNQA